MALTEDAGHDIARDWAEFGRRGSKPQACLRCGRGDRLCWNGMSIRTASVRAGDETVHVAGVSQRRLKCKACDENWIHRPPGLLPNKHFQGCVIASAVSQHVHGGDTLARVAATHGCSPRQAGRWMPWTAAIADPAALAAQVVEAVDAVVLPAARELAQRFEALRHAARRPMLRRAAQVLALMEALALALGLEPPGLRAIVERALNGRTDVGTYRRPVIPELALVTRLM